MELRITRATFVYFIKGKLVALLNLHVDDGLLAGSHSSPEYKLIRAKINKNFKIKHWHVVGKDRSQDYLGMQWERNANR